MPNVSVRNVKEGERAAVPVFNKSFERFDQIQKRAFELFEKRNCEPGHAVEDWLMAEKEILGSSAPEFSDNGNSYEFRVELPGFDVRDVRVIATADEVIVHAATEKERQLEEEDGLWTELRSSDVYERIQAPNPIEPGKVEAALEQGVLRITAPKLIATKEKVLAIAG